VALVIPPLFGFSEIVVRNAQLTTFLAFGCFALMVMADFGGLRKPRAAAYVVTTAVGAVLVVLGTLISPIAWLGALAMFLVAFSIQLSSVFGGYAAAAQPALLLSFVLAVSIPAPPDQVWPRLTGWLVAGAVSTLASALLWPRFEGLQLRKKAAEASQALADLLHAEQRSAPEAEITEARRSAGDAVQALRRDYFAAPKRPAGPTRRDRAFVELITDLERMSEFMGRLYGRRTSSHRPCTVEGDRLATEILRTLRSSADVLTGGPPPDLRTLNEARDAHRRALDDWAAGALRAGRPAEEVLDGLDADHPVRVISYVALAVGSNALATVGGHPESELRPPAGTPRVGPGRVLLRVARTLRTHLTPDSSVLHNALRAGIGLGVAVLLARLLQVDHAFWVVLGTMSVLRSNALATGRTTLEALLGTLLGFAVGAAFTAVAGSTPLLWMALPVTIFLAAYAPNAIGFLVGQAAFTIYVLVLFNLITPVGWRLGLARIEDIAIGVAISLMVSLLLWPRGARRELSRSVAGFYRSVAMFIGSSFGRVVEGGPSDDSARTRLLAVRARDRAGEALEQLLNERAAKHLDPELAAFLIASGARVMLIGDLLNVVAEMGYRADGCPKAAEALRGETQASQAALSRLADRLDQTPVEAEADIRDRDGDPRQAALRCLSLWRRDPSTGRSAIAVVAAEEWIQHLSELTEELQDPVAEVARVGRVPWWR
jgi:uncharacterized membrane protein YccC